MGFGGRGTRTGELVFTTSMNGYPESLTDPSYKGQILIITHPLVGNYGVPKKRFKSGVLENFESPKLEIDGLVVSELTNGKKWNSATSLENWLRQDGVPGIQGIDTRTLTQKVRERGVLKCIISSTSNGWDRSKLANWAYENTDYVGMVSPKRPIIHGSGKQSVVVVDFGVKHGILWNLLSLGFRVIRVPHNYSSKKILAFKPAGAVYSNGPGNPNLLQKEAKVMKELMEYKMPILAVCLGHQIATIALGGEVKKMKFGHRAINKAVVDVFNHKSYITTHNHGYAALKKDVPEECKLWFLSPDDGVAEGMVSDKYRLLTTQFHPEARPGTNDSLFVFSRFQKMVNDAHT